mmetsp:Transcript_69701/g.167323  ORF Transcript_69701/g.167323 Transcript_69701/m.167323 type:complete len:208 (+) Transcript_69701:311-934(+)
MPEQCLSHMWRDLQWVGHSALEHGNPSRSALMGSRGSTLPRNPRPSLTSPEAPLYLQSKQPQGPAYPPSGQDQHRSHRCLRRAMPQHRCRSQHPPWGLQLVPPHGHRPAPAQHQEDPAPRPWQMSLRYVAADTASAQMHEDPSWHAPCLVRLVPMSACWSLESSSCQAPRSSSTRVRCQHFPWLLLSNVRWGSKDPEAIAVLRFSFF